MEITKKEAPAIADYYRQLMGVPGHITYVDAGYFAAKARIIKVDGCDVTYEIHADDAERLREKIEEAER